MPVEKWLISPGDTRVIDVPATPKVKIGLVGGQVDVIAHDEPTIRIEVHSVTQKDLRIELTDDLLEIDHAQLRWDNFLEVFRNFTATGPKAEISVAVPRSVALTLGVVSASALVAGLENGAKLNTVSGDIVVDGLTGDLSVNAVSGETQVRDLDGRFTANTVSGDVTVVGTPPKVSIDTVSGDMLVDASGYVHDISLNTVSGDSTIRLDDSLAANYVMRTVSGKILLDGSQHTTVGPSNVTATRGDLSGQFVDARVNAVSGSVTVLRRAAPATAAPSGTSGSADATEPQSTPSDESYGTEGSAS
ncbi:DUF4097 family beta strand repeat-containing protein [Microbacterium sp. NC79]|uniref:DUF4097 family beta strand repeat-containing protein n=1 Tax=Microbacterium sp. NC79 TaxID=2851009 RepID=UPI001C2BA9ED|nr:DUF4097 family beta strand repeat-containing protein [Microbacterium sp. NC79]MBV0895896.1 DUF4097 domain-containing protein [Microbacterium sp. NC79]